jgi:hypothetical protein
VGDQPNQPAYPAGANLIAVQFGGGLQNLASLPLWPLRLPASANFCPSAPAPRAAQVTAISRGEILLRLIVWHIRPKFQRKNGAAAMILCAGERLTDAGPILIYLKERVFRDS